jgi:branched-chain amino acid transport system ATP-binding protein
VEPGEEPLLAVRDLTRRFGGFTAVQKVSFTVGEGEILGLIGPNGSGKSTTFNLIAGALAPSEGSIRLRGREIGGAMPNEVCRAGIARTFQIPRPFRKLSLLENASLAAFYGSAERLTPADADRQAAEALDLVGLPSSSHAQVDGLGAAGLKKLEMARALATRPRLLLADESLGGLDEQEMEQAADMLSLIRRERGITIVWVEHIMGVLMRVVDRCLVLDHGEVIAQGTPAEVANHPRVIEVYLGTDAAQVQGQVQGQVLRQGREPLAPRGPAPGGPAP